MYSPIVNSIKVIRSGKVRKAKLYYLRDRTGKSARIAEKIKKKIGIDVSTAQEETVGKKAEPVKVEEKKAEPVKVEEKKAEPKKIKEKKSDTAEVKKEIQKNKTQKEKK